LLRGSKDGFTPKKFHELCDNIFSTVTFIIKVKETEEIIGGYNPLKWKAHSEGLGEWGITRDSFIFSFKNKNNVKDPILSYVKNMNRAIYYRKMCGPSFGDQDFELNVGGYDDTKEYEDCWCSKRDYEKEIIDTTEDDIFFQ
jgi:hypothetical protein